MVSANHKKGLRAASRPEAVTLINPIIQRWKTEAFPNQTGTTWPRSLSYWGHEAVTPDQSCLNTDPKAFPATSELSGVKALKRNVGQDPFFVEELIL